MAKIRVYELAKEFGVPTKYLMAYMKNIGEFVRSASSTIEPPVARHLRTRVATDGTGQMYALGQYGSLDVLLSLRKTSVADMEASVPNPGIKVLDLTGTSLVEIPTAVMELPNLEVILASGLGLTSVPAALSTLRHLLHIDLSENGISEIPSQLASLPNLEVLDVRSNRLTVLPSAMARALKNGLNLQIENNPLDEPLPALIQRGADALAAYLSSLGHELVQSYEARVVLVGEGNVGKSSLAAALNGQSFVEGRPTTHGMEILQLDVPHPVEFDVNMRLALWDFGGQEVYRITHQFFFSPRCLYLVVWNPREGMDENAVEDWIRRIRIRVGSQAKVLIVATHGDERRAEIDYPLLEERFPEILVGNFIVDNASGTGIKALRQAIAEEASRLPQMGHWISRTWESSRAEIEQLASSNFHISYEKFSLISRENGIEDEAEIETLADLLHDLGYIVHFGDDAGLSELVVLNAEWLTKAIGYVLEDKETRRRGGVLDHSRLGVIWGSDDAARLRFDPRLYPYFLRLMEKFDVSYRIHDADASLVGQLTPVEMPAIRWTWREDLRTLRLTFVFSDKAPGLIPWLIVRNHHASTGLHWRRGVFLRHPISEYESEALIELSSDDRLWVEVSAPSPDFYMSSLRDGIEYLIRWRWPGLNYEIYVPCPGRRSRESCSNEFPLAGLLRFRSTGRRALPCLYCGVDVDVDELLTGFGGQTGSLEQEVARVAQSLREVAGGIGRIEIAAAQSALALRSIQKAISAEVDDCPRLFTLRPLPSNRLRTHLRFEVTLWCEQPGMWHPCETRRYVFEQPKEWFSRVSPYVRFVAKSLKLLTPVAGAAVDLAVPESVFDSTSKAVELANAVAGMLPEGTGESEVDPGDVTHIDALGPAEGEGLRAFRAMLFRVDEVRSFAGLRAVLTETGDRIWLCGTHYSHYDPGLPTI